MGIINVKGLGRVRIAGDVPTEEERQNMLKALRGEVSGAPPAEPEEEEGFIEQAASAALRGASGLVRGLTLSTPLAIAEALDLEGARIPKGMTAEEAAKSPDVVVSPAAWAHKKWEEWEEGLYKPTYSADEALERAGNLDVKPLLQFIGEGVAGSVPHMAGVMLAGAPRYAGAVIGDLARERSRNRGDEETTWGDVAFATGAASLIAPLERVGAKVALTGGGAKTLAGRTGMRAVSELATELPQTAVEQIGGQAFTREGEQYVMGVDPGQMKEALTGAALVAPVAGAGFGALGASRRLPGEVDRAASIRHAEELAGAVMADGATVTAQDIDPDAAKAKLEEVAALAAAPAPQPQVVEVPVRPTVGERAERPEPRAPARKDMADAVQAIVDPTVDDDVVRAKALLALARAHAEQEGLEGPGIAAKHADVDPVMLRAADELGLSERAKEALTQRDRVSIAETIQAAEDQGITPRMVDLGVVENSAKLETIVESVIKRGHAPSTIEEAGMHAALRLNERAREDILAAVERGDSGLSHEELADRLNKVNQSTLNLGLALGKGGSELGRALRYRQHLANKVRTLSEANSAAQLKKGRVLTDKESSLLKGIWDKAEANEQAGKKARTSGIKRLDMAKKSLEAARKTGNERTIDAAERALEDVQNDIVKAEQKIRMAQRDKAAAADTVATPKLVRVYKRIFGASLVLSASGDNSALGRQAMGLFVQNPVKALKTLPIAFQLAPWSRGHRAYAKRIQQTILNAKMQELRDLAGLELTEIEGLSNVVGGDMLAREEAFMFRAMETGVLGDNLIMPSQNAFGITLNLLRAANFDQGVRMLAEAHGADPNSVESIKAKVPKADLDGLAMLINASTGRGRWAGGTGPIANIMRHTMFAPRFTMSRFETPYRAVEAVLGVGKFEGTSEAARSQFRKRIGRQLAFMMGIGTMTALLADDDPEDNILAFMSPKSGDFLKLRMGDYHMDFTGGIAGSWRYVLPLLLGGERPGAAMSQMARNKVAPLIGALDTLVRGTDFRGRKVTHDALKTDKAMQEFFNTKVNDYLSIALHRAVFPAMGAFTPITVQNVAEEAWSSMTGEEKERLQRAMPIILDAFGIGTRHYDPQETRGQRRRGPRPPSLPTLPRP